MARRRRVRPRGRADGRVHRRARGVRAPRRRPETRFGGKGVLHAVANVNGAIADAIRGADALRPAAVDRALLDLDGTADKSALGANAILGVSLAVANAAADSSGTPLYPLPRRAERARAPDADAERDQRRRARRQRARAAGVHADAGRRGIAFARRSDGARRCFHALKGLLTGRGHVHGGRRRGRVRAGDLDGGRRAELPDAGDRDTPGSSPATDVALAMDPATCELYRDGTLPARGRGAERRRHGRVLGRARRSASRSSRSRTRSPRTIGTAGPPSPRLAVASSSSATTCS